MYGAIKEWWSVIILRVIGGASLLGMRSWVDRISSRIEAFIVHLPTVRRFNELSLKSKWMIYVGLTWMFTGWGVMHEYATVVPQAYHTVIPEEARGFIWLASGLICIISALIRKYKKIALAGLLIMPSIRITSYLWAWLMWIIPGMPQGWANGWYQAAYQGVHFGIVLLIARLPERGNFRTREN